VKGSKAIRPVSGVNKSESRTELARTVVEAAKFAGRVELAREAKLVDVPVAHEQPDPRRVPDLEVAHQTRQTNVRGTLGSRTSEERGYTW
jgi:hypothetical protein